MRAGQQVTYISGATGRASVATIVAVDGSGPSGFKTLTLAFDNGEQIEHVQHIQDEPSGRYCWTLEPPAPLADAGVPSAPRRRRGTRLLDET